MLFRSGVLRRGMLRRMGKVGQSGKGGGNARKALRVVLAHSVDLHTAELALRLVGPETFDPATREDASMSGA